MGQRGEYSHVPEKRRSPGDQAAQHEHQGRKGGGEGIRCSSLIRSPATGARFDWVTMIVSQPEKQLSPDRSAPPCRFGFLRRAEPSSAAALNPFEFWRKSFGAPCDKSARRCGLYCP